MPTSGTALRSLAVKTQIGWGVGMNTTVALAAGIGVLQRPMKQVEHEKTAGMGYDGEPVEAYEPSIPLKVSKDQTMVPPVSTTMKCIISLAALYFATYAAKLILETLNEAGIVEREKEEKCMALAKETVFFVPMLCVLFLATRFRAVELTGGQTEKFGLPQIWVKRSMVCCSWAVCSQTALAIFGALRWGETWEYIARSEAVGWSRKACILAKSMAMLIMYVSMGVVCFGACEMHLAPSLKGFRMPDVNVSLICTLILTILFFLTHLSFAAVKVFNEFQTRRFGFSQELLKRAALTVSFSSMLCVLFLAARMRMSLLDVGKRGMGPTVQFAFCLCTVGMLLQTALTTASFTVETLVAGHRGVLGIIGGGETKSEHLALQVIEAVRLVAALFLFIGVALVLGGMCFLRPEAAQAASGQSIILLASGCCMFLSTLYFAVYFVIGVIDVLQTFRVAPAPHATHLRKDRPMVLNVKEFLLGRTREAVQLCPMVSMILLGSAMRASQAPKSSIPSSKVEAIAAVVSLTVLAFSRLDEIFASTHRRVSLACEVLQYISLTTLYASAAAILVENLILL